MIRYTPRTVSYAKELTSVYICYSQGNGFNTRLSMFYILHTLCSSDVVVVLLVFRTVADSKDYVCTLPTSPRINRPPHLDHHAHAP